MTILFWALTFGIVGKVLLAAGVILAHMELAKEKQIDDLVLRYFRMEYFISFFGVLLMIVGYLLELYFYQTVEFVLLP